MEAEYVGQRRRRRVIVLLGLLLAVIAAGATYYLATRPTGETTPPPMQTVVVATQTIAARSQIGVEQLTTQEVTQNQALRNAPSDPALVAGNVALVTINAGDLILPAMYGQGNENGVTILGPDETLSPEAPVWRAVSVEVPVDRAVGGLIAADDHVDLFVSLQPQLFDTSGGPAVASPFTITDPGHDVLTDGYYSEVDSTTKLTWTNLEVLSADPDNNIYVLKVDEHQAEEIAHVQAIDAKFTLGLRPAGDERDVDRTTYGQTTNKMIDHYGFPIPNMIQIPIEVPSSAPSPPPY